MAKNAKKFFNKYGIWTVQERIDNQVYRQNSRSVILKATNPKGEEAALKVLIKVSNKTYKRFRDEITTVIQYNEHSGILPILEHYLPDNQKKSQPWYAMPIARTVRQELEGRLDIKLTVKIMASIAVTLADLAERIVYHRDIKPDNLFILDGRPVVGDFGLVDFPGKEQVTAVDRPLGPSFFIADEMISNPDTADAGPADVFSFLKSLYVLCKGDTWPPQGQQRLDYTENLLSTYFGSTATPLDLLIERGTSPIPNERPSMRVVAEELTAWLEPEIPSADITNPSELFRPIKEKTEPTRRAITKVHGLINAIHSVTQRFQPVLSKIKSIYIDSFYSVRDEQGGPFLNKAAIALGKPETNNKIKFSPKSVSISATTGNGVYLDTGIDIWLTPDNSMNVVAAHVLHIGSKRDNYDVLWSDIKSFMPGSAKEKLSIAELEKGLQDSLPIVAEKINEAMESTPTE